jgi:hypothetical protein
MASRNEQYELDSLATRLSVCLLSVYEYNHLFALLLTKLAKVINSKKKRFQYLDPDEVESTSNLEVYYALEKYEPDRSFAAWCNLRIHRRLNSHAKFLLKGDRDKYYVCSLDQERVINPRGTFLSGLSGSLKDILSTEYHRNAEDAKDILAFLKPEDFSDLEWKIYQDFMAGLSQKEIGIKRGIPSKMVDNSRSRFIRKARLKLHQFVNLLI